MSSELSEYIAIKPTTIRRDFSLIGSLGKQGYGYNVDELIKIFSGELGVDFAEKIVLIGAGKLGKAILNYNCWNHVAGEIVCAFDKNPAGCGKIDVPLYDIKDLHKKMPKGCRIAIICITSGTQEVVDELAEVGVKGIINFTSEHFMLPKGMTARNVDVVATIQELLFEVNTLNK